MHTELCNASVQLHLPMFPVHEIAAWQEHELRKTLEKEEARAKRLAKPPKIKVVQHKHANQLALALIEVDLTERLVGNAPHELDTHTCPLTAPSQETVEDGKDQASEEWSQLAVEELHETVLHYSLNTLQARGNSQEKKEVLQWIFAPETYVVTIKGEDGQPIEAYLPQQVTPFSFEQCCRICGYNSERLMNELEPILHKLGIQHIL